MNDDDCICDWPTTCGGLGMLLCEGCGGDLCVCACGGELDCDGCEQCPDDDDDDDDPGDDAEEGGEA